MGTTRRRYTLRETQKGGGSEQGSPAAGSSAAVGGNFTACSDRGKTSEHNCWTTKPIGEAWYGSKKISFFSPTLLRLGGFGIYEPLRLLACSLHSPHWAPARAPLVPGSASAHETALWDRGEVIRGDGNSLCLRMSSEELFVASTWCFGISDNLSSNAVEFITRRCWCSYVT